MLYTTLNRLRENEAYPERVPELANYAPDEPIPLTRILETCGLLAALRTLCATTTPWKVDRLVGSLACDLAEHFLPLFKDWHPNDDRPQRAIETARRCLRGEATRGEVIATLRGAFEASWEAEREADNTPYDGGVARDASYAADEAARAAATVAGIHEFPTSVFNLIDSVSEKDKWMSECFVKLLETSDEKED